MKFIFTYSFLLVLASTLCAQGLNIPTNQRVPKSDFSIGVELGGSVISPIKSSIANNGNVKIRPQLLLMYRISNNIYLDFSFEYNKVEQREVYTNFNDYRMTGMAFKQSVVFQTKNYPLFFGFGLMESFQKERRTVVVKGNYFGDYVRPASHSVSGVSLFTKIGADIKLKEYLKFKFEGTIFASSLSITNQQGIEKQSINYLAGSSLINSTKGEYGIGVRAFAYLVYSF